MSSFLSWFRPHHFLLLGICLVGCDSQPRPDANSAPRPRATFTIFSSINLSKETIYVDKMDGFRLEPPVGVLVPNAVAQANWKKQEIPARISITWWKGEREKQKIAATTTTIDITGYDPSNVNSILYLTFGADEKWSLAQSPTAGVSL
ncbi:MAG: hypothetical protein JWN70_2309 [Planctomycetaceae bacterium]|nr:hypothetical protein [Planctomycetaceae bacterium]